MNDIKIAFYKNGPGNIHKFIRWWTKSEYSHAELILPDGITWAGISPFLKSEVSLRIKHQVRDQKNWDYLTFSLSDRDPVKKYQLDQLYKFIDLTQGHKYDWTGMLLSQFTPFLVKRKRKWYCSEWIAHALVNARIIMWDDLKVYDIPDLSPGKLYNILNSLKEEDKYQRRLLNS